MKISHKSLIASALFAIGALGAGAQPAPKILVVDMVKLYDGHYKTAEQNAVWTKDQQEATAELQKIQATINDMKAQYLALDGQVKNTMLKDDVRAKAQADAQKIYTDLQAKNNEGLKLQNDFTAAINQRIKTFRDIMFEEIGKIAADIGKKKGATLVLNKSAIDAVGIPTITFSDASYDITDEVMEQINKDKPAPVAAPPLTAPLLNKGPTAAPAAPAK